jgi:hypothetical protein
MTREGRPAKIRLGRIEVCQRVEPVGVETDGDDDEIGMEFLNPGTYRDLECLAKLVSAVTRSQRRIDDVVVIAALERSSRFRDRAASRESHHPPCHEPCARTKVLGDHH